MWIRCIFSFIFSFIFACDQVNRRMFSSVLCSFINIWFELNAVRFACEVIWAWKITRPCVYRSFSLPDKWEKKWREKRCVKPNERPITNIKRTFKLIAVSHRKLQTSIQIFHSFQSKLRWFCSSWYSKSEEIFLFQLETVKFHRNYRTFITWIKLFWIKLRVCSSQ